MVQRSAFWGALADGMRIFAGALDRVGPQSREANTGLETKD